jgi:hypothetical protein
LVGRLTVNLNDAVNGKKPLQIPPNALKSFAPVLDDWRSLKNEEKMVGRIAFKLTHNGTTTIAAESSPRDDAIYAESVLRSALAVVEKPSSTKTAFGKVEHIIDVSSSLSGPLQFVSSNISVMASSIAPLGDAIKSIDRLMQFFDKLADVSLSFVTQWKPMNALFRRFIPSSRLLGQF